MNKTELFIHWEGAWRAIDLSENQTFPITFNIADVRDITKRNGSFTKTLSLPDTVNNSQLFDFIFDVSNMSSFDVNRKVRAYVLCDTIQVLEGFLQLKNIVTKDNIHFTYDCVIYADNNVLIKTIGDGYINEMDFSELDHTLSYANISNTWTQKWGLGYYYPLIDYNSNYTTLSLQNGLDLTEMKAAVYVKYIWEKIISDAGFTYYGGFKNNETFENLIIPDGFDVIGRDETNSFLNRLYIGITSSYDVKPLAADPGPPSPGGLTLPFQYGDGTPGTGFNPRVPLTVDTTPFGDPAEEWDSTNFEYIAPNNELDRRFVIGLRVKVYNDYQNGLSGFFSNGGYLTMRFVREFNPTDALTIPVGSLTPYSQNSGFYAGLPGGTRYGYPIPILNAPITDLGNNEVLFPGKYYFLTVPDGLSDATIAEPFEGFSGSGGRNSYSITPIFDQSNVVEDVPGAGGYKIYEGQIQTPFLDQATMSYSDINRVRLFPGEKAWVEVDSFYTRSAYNSIFATGGVPFEVLNASIFTDIDQPEKKHKAKKKDFVTSIIKMFNLFIEPDRDNPNNLLIDTRDEYYASGGEVDWSEKLDISKDINQKIIAETGPRRYLFTHKKDDKDYLNKYYENQVAEIYGQYEYLVDNDFNEGESKIETIFSPSILADLGPLSDTIIPVYRSVDNNNSPGIVYGGIRILQRGTQSIALPNSKYWVLGGVTQSTYPYAGHFNHPTDGTTDINFGQPKVLYYQGNFITNNNLYNVYYRRMIEELTDRDSRIVTANFFLTPNDINKLRFNDRVFVQSMASGTGNYFRINKIEYDPIRKGSFRVELLKIKDLELKLTLPKTGNSDFLNPTGWKETLTNIDYARNKQGSNTLVVGNNNSTVEGSGIYVFGDRNSTGYKTNGFVYGTDNKVEAKSEQSAILGGNKNFIFGSDNSAIIAGSENFIGKDSDNAVIIGGNNNSIGANLPNTIIIGGEGQTLREPNTIMIGGTLVLVSNFISAGRDEVLNLYPTNKVINYLSASRDVVRQYNSYSIESIVNGGRDSVI